MVADTEKRVNGEALYRFMKVKLCLTNLVDHKKICCDLEAVSSRIGKGKPMGLVNLDFNNESHK